MQPFITRFLEGKKSHLHPATVGHYSRHLKAFSEVVKKPLPEVTERDLSKFRAILEEKYNPVTVSNVFRTIRNLYISYGRKGIVDPDLVKVPKARPSPRTPVSFDEHDALLSVIPEYDYPSLQLKLILSLLWDAGPRINELLDLRTEHVGHCEATIPTEKTKSSRRIYWGPETQRLLERYMPIRREIQRSPFLFLGLWNDGRVTERITARSVQNALKKYCKLAGIRPIIPHEYRHSRIQRWLGNGLSPHEVINLSGHTSVVSLESYMRLGNDKVRELARRCL